MRLGRSFARIGVVMLLAVLAACGKADNVAMPLTRENILAYQEKLVESQNNITKTERSEIGASPEKAAKVFRNTFIKPLEEMGYDYDKTVRSFARAVIDGKTPDKDPEVKTLAEGVIVMAKGTEPFAVKHGFITAETKRLLDSININVKK